MIETFLIFIDVIGCVDGIHIYKNTYKNKSAQNEKPLINRKNKLNNHVLLRMDGSFTHIVLFGKRRNRDWRKWILVRRSRALRNASNLLTIPEYV